MSALFRFATRRLSNGNTIAELCSKLAYAELDRDSWRGQVVTIRGQQRDALARAKAAELELRRIKGGGDESDVRAGRCCPSCRTDLTEHNRGVWEAGYSVGQRHGRDEDR